MQAGITAEQIVEIFENDRTALKRLAALIASEPDVRLALIEAVLREVATKADTEKLRRELHGEIERVKGELQGEIRRVREELLGEMGRVKGELHGEVRRVEGKLRREVRQTEERLRADIETLRAEVKELRDRLWWVVATVVLGWIAVMLEQFLLLTLAK